MKKIAIIGSNSFLAKNFLKYSIDNKLNYHFELYDYVRENEWPQFEYTKIDFDDIEDIKRINMSVDIIIIFIGKTGTTNGFMEYQSFINVNETILLNILQHYVDSNSTARIIYPSTRLIFKSKEDELINESGEKECKSIYAVTKYAAENYLKIYKDSFGVDYVILRICTPYGSLIKNFGNYGTFEIFNRQATEDHKISVFGDGSQRKTYTSIEDVCRAFTLVSEANVVNRLDYNIGGQELSLKEIANKIANNHNVNVDYVDWPDAYKIVDGGSVVFDSSAFDDEFNMHYKKIL